MSKSGLWVFVLLLILSDFYIGTKCAPDYSRCKISFCENKYRRSTAILWNAEWKNKERPVHQWNTITLFLRWTRAPLLSFIASDGRWVSAPLHLHTLNLHCSCSAVFVLFFFIITFTHMWYLVYFVHVLVLIFQSIFVHRI